MDSMRFSKELLNISATKTEGPELSAAAQLKTAENNCQQNRGSQEGEVMANYNLSQ